MKNVSITLLLLSVLILIMTTGCKKDPEPSLYDPNYVSGPQPIIERMDPPDSSYAGVGTIDVYGKYFIPKEPYEEYNQLYFNEVMADILQMTDSKITIASPAYIGDSIKVKIAVRGSDKFSEPVYYKLKAAVDTTFGRLDDFKQKRIAYAIATDSKGNVYVSTRVETTPPFGQILRINKQGEPTIWVDNTVYLKANAMKVGPNNKLYVAYALGRIKEIATIDLADSTLQETYTRLATVPNDIDFDQDGNLWVAAQTELVKVKPDRSKETLATFSLFLQSIRVHEEGGTTYIYLTGQNLEQNEQKVWRYPLNDDGSIGAEEIILDAATDSWLVKEDGNLVDIKAITFSADGKMYLATDMSPDALVIYDMTTRTYDFQYPGLIKPKLLALSWFGNIIYASQTNFGETDANVLRIDVGKSGAPYYGRQ
ncbi:hypothetical protein Calab_1566 [Caldithrix abyssi DSM 13497]|uniref:Uncharacterized protein n=1 Tax=Caldithrix abyssi DSM 13497 TaxID=880073 RepID=H1XQP0_CALAY|nr:hypothetical protein [Caldithrix abyssi]APF17035.1 hypothetical protein Cabys_284 [Caldithrix abyssi DSM 13497]EHO41186.1 hypothetical protein Calab_1566 [Caldithrix abyssi DSM 13497]